MKKSPLPAPKSDEGGSRSYVQSSEFKVQGSTVSASPQLPFAICHLPSAIPVPVRFPDRVCSFVSPIRRRPIRAGGRKLTFARLRKLMSDPAPAPASESWHSFVIRHWSFVICAGLALCTLATGCQVLSYRSPRGERFVRSSFGANTSIQSLALESDTNGVRHVELRGYQNESTRSEEHT